MKLGFSSLMFAFLSVTFGLVPQVSLRTLAQTTADINFLCGEDNGVPTTISSTPDGVKLVIRWTRSLAGYSPVERCEIASSRFQKYMVQQGMDSITIINRNGFPVVCAYRLTDGEGCNSDLFTATSWAAAEDAKQRLRNLSWYIVGADAIEQGGQESFSFNLMGYLRDNSESGNDIFPLIQ